MTEPNISIQSFKSRRDEKDESLKDRSIEIIWRSNNNKKGMKRNRGYGTYRTPLRRPQFINDGEKVQKKAKILFQK